MPISNTVNDLRAASFNAKAALDSGLVIGEPVVRLADAERKVRELEAQMERQQIDLPLACPHCKKLIGYNVEE